MSTFFGGDIISLTLRPYQQDIIAKIRASWLSGHRRNILVLPCGGGKTAIFAYMARAAALNGKVVWFLVHRSELLDQTIETFKRFGIPLDNIFIGMVATAANHPDNFPEPDFIIFDECHFSAATTWRRIIDTFPAAYITGLTATPCRLDGKPLGAIYTDLCEGVSARWLIDNGYLSGYRYFAPPTADCAELKIKGHDYDMSEAAELLSSRKVFSDVIESYKKYADGVKAICYCTTIAHSKATADAFREAGIAAAHFDGDTPKRERERIVSDFRQGKITVLCNVDLISVGFDCPDCGCSILLRPTMSTALFIQQAMRCMRYCEGKIAIIIDCVNNYQRHGLPDDERQWSLSAPFKCSGRTNAAGEFRVRQCGNCYATFPSSEPCCPVCGEVYRKPRAEIESIREVELSEITRKKREQAERYKQAVAEKLGDKRLSDCKNACEIMAWCRKNGKKTGYGYYYAKKRGYL